MYLSKYVFKLKLNVSKKKNEFVDEFEQKLYQLFLKTNLFVVEKTKLNDVITKV